MEDIIFWLRQFPKPYETWLAIERELLADSLISRELGSVTLLAGAIMQTLPSSERNDNLQKIQSLAQTAWNFYESLFNGDPADFNDRRMNLRSSIKGLLAAPVGRPPKADAMIQKQVKIALPVEDMEWLESQPNQSEAIRLAISHYRARSRS